MGRCLLNTSKCMRSWTPSVCAVTRSHTVSVERSVLDCGSTAPQTRRESRDSSRPFTFTQQLHRVIIMVMSYDDLTIPVRRAREVCRPTPHTRPRSHTFSLIFVCVWNLADPKRIPCRASRMTTGAPPYDAASCASPMRRSSWRTISCGWTWHGCATTMVSTSCRSRPSQSVGI